jgi:hypothetical protein
MTSPRVSAFTGAVVLVACALLAWMQYGNQAHSKVVHHTLLGGSTAEQHTTLATAQNSFRRVPIDSSLVDLIRRLPKAELHIHIEGTLEPEMMMKFAARNNVTLPYASLEEAKAARCGHTCWAPT